MNLDRQLRRRLLGRLHSGWVYPGPGCAEALSGELRSLLDALETPAPAPPVVKSLRSGVVLERVAYRTLLEIVLRVTTAQEVSLVIAEGPAHNRVQFESLLREVHWDLFLAPGSAARLHVESHASTLYHKGLLRDCVARVLAERGSRLVGLTAADSPQRLRVHVSKDRARVEISLAGEPLWQRGYRAALGAVAPIREDLAQSAIRLAFRETSLPDASAAPPALLLPFAGSGTFLFEYLIARYAMPPFLFRSVYAFEQFAGGAPASVGWLKRRLAGALRLRVAAAPPLVARLVDRSPDAAESVAANRRAFYAAVERSIGGAGPALDLDCATADAFSRPWREWLPREVLSVFLPLNPPYGLRLATRSTDELYRRSGRACRELAAALPRGGLRGFVLCPSEASWRSFRRAAGGIAAETSHFTHGGLDIRLCHFRG